MSHAASVPLSAEWRAEPTCGACGHTEDLGVVAAKYRNPLRQIGWRLSGARAAQRRVALWNAHVARHLAEQE